MSYTFNPSIFSHLNDDDILQFSEKGDLIKVRNFKECYWKSIYNNSLRSYSGIPLEFVLSLNDFLRNYKIQLKNLENILDTGIECEVLRIGSQGWEKGKIRIKFEIEFIPDAPEIQEPESCLDDIRREIQKM